MVHMSWLAGLTPTRRPGVWMFGACEVALKQPPPAPPFTAWLWPASAKGDFEEVHAGSMAVYEHSRLAGLPRPSA
jgi:hypothetical protein